MDIKTLTKSDIGRWVEYRGGAGEVERGRIKSWNDSYIFVVYKCNDEWDRFQDFTGVSTRPEDLKPVLTLQDLKDRYDKYTASGVDHDRIIATGVEDNSPDGVFMTRDGGRLQWVACIGGGFWDWKIYCHWEGMSIGYILSHGDKIHDEDTIRRLVPCDDEAFELYRH